MRFFKPTSTFYCGIDLHARVMYICIIDKEGNILVHKNILNTNVKKFLKLIGPYKHDIVVACESCYAWYWLADLCAEHNIKFILGHALYMKAIHGAKIKNDKVDSQKIAMLVQSGMFPLAYVYPRNKRSVRDLLRRRLYFAQERADMFSHIQQLNTQVNNEPLGRITKTNYKKKAVANEFEDLFTKKSIKANLTLIEVYDEVIRDLEVTILQYTRKHFRQELTIMQSLHGIGDIISLTILYEVENINRFPTVGELLSYSRVVRCTHESAGKKYLGSNKKIGNAYFKRAFSEAAVFVIKFNPNIKKYFERLVSRKNKAKAYGIISRKIAQVIYFMLKNKEVFDEKRFLMS